ncbi:MAG: DNA-binding transcriptional LysR family regulator [Gammaproteobacteria bacterium]|jgi:DNA-binding transcriptional LysR family regulator
MNRYDQLAAFVAVVDGQSFSKAGERLLIARSLISRRVSDLESRLGVQLLQRTTRSLSLTDSGKLFYQRAAQILVDIEEAEQIVSNEQCNLSGKIRLAAPLGLGARLLAEPIARFMDLHPGIEIDVDLNDRQTNLIEENRDIAIRIGELEDSTLIARRLANVEMGVCASPAYLEQYGIPQHPTDLNQHQVVLYSNANLSSQFSLQEKGIKIPIKSRYRLSANNGEFLIQAVIEGLAIGGGPKFFLRTPLEEGTLKLILQDYQGPPLGLYAVYPPGRLVSTRVKMLSDYFKVHFLNLEI